MADIRRPPEVSRWFHGWATAVWATAPKHEGGQYAETKRGGIRCGWSKFAPGWRRSGRSRRPERRGEQ